MNRNLYFYCILLLLVQSCSWNRSLYDEYVSDSVVSPCPPRIFEQNGRLVTYQIAENPDDGTTSVEPVHCDKYGIPLDDPKASIVIEPDENDGNYYLNISDNVRWRLYAWDDVKAHLKDHPPISYIIKTDGDSCQNEDSGCYTQCTIDTCPEFENAFLYGICPKQSSFCEMNIVDEENVEFFCRPKPQSCQKNEHVYRDKCEPDSLDNCGFHGYKCDDNVAGWNGGRCEDGRCKPDSCAIGYHEKNSICVRDDNDNCGKEENPCLIGEVCLDGKCNANCSKTDVACTSADGTSVKCIDPLTSNEYCGANPDCTEFAQCTDGKKCTNGDCVQQSCTDTTLTLCTVNTGEELDYTCIDTNGNDPEHCGGCNYTCSDHPLSNAISNKCEDGKCQYECEKDYINCGSDDAPECISITNMDTDPNHCGGCDGKCKEDEYCDGSECIKSTCASTKSCLDLVTKNCVNSDTKCGIQCLNCNIANHAASGKCSNGSCVINSCAKGYHKTGSGTCAENTNASCGSQQSSNAVNCNTNGNAASGVCTVNGTCRIFSCKPGFHLSGNSCVKDSVSACGSNPIKCTSLSGWKSGDCKNGKCVAKTCDNDYCLRNNTCYKGKQNPYSCGIKSASCKTCSAKQYCSNGSCKKIP